MKLNPLTVIMWRGNAESWHLSGISRGYMLSSREREREREGEREREREAALECEH